ncbi:uncharacterized protein CBL_01468 [Carabus blaptoides fortunei]
MFIKWSLNSVSFNAFFFFKKINNIYILYLLAVFQPQRNSLQFRQQNLFQIQEDAVLTVPGLISKYGYPVEEHSVTTEDGYILSMHRIPHGKSGPSHDRPVVYIQHGFLSNSADAILTGPENALVPGPIIQALSRVDFKILKILDTLGIYQFTPQRALQASAGQLFCSDGSPTQSICAAGLYSLGGFDEKNFNTSILPIFFGHVPDSFSIKELAHFSQLVKSGRFRNFDYGTVGNLQVYNRTEPPDYDLSKVTAPVAIYCSENDWQSSAVDADQLYQELGNPIDKFVLAERPNHYSYFHGKNMRQILYSRMAEVMHRY